ncbi:MAG: type 2 isopentenyl-diphosphate Delta-isomerase [Pseudomonadota bacterium]
MTKRPSPDISQRKSDHINVVLEGDVGFGRVTSGFETVQFIHNALPELSLVDIDIGTQFLGRRLNAPFLISSMTGGPGRAGAINAHLCEAAEALGIALGVGSQRIALEEQGASGLTTDLRRRAPSIPLIGNLGGAQILGDAGVSRARRAFEMIEADALFIHLNPLQEAVQAGGDVDWRGVLSAIGKLVDSGLPIIVKEVGFGLSADVVRRLSDVGVTMIDVAGAGGTNWARVEGAREAHGSARRLAGAFTEWGIPTALAVRQARDIAPNSTIIASGGVVDGVAAAKAVRLGADLVGQAAGTLVAATQSAEAVVDHFQTMIEMLKITCFCTGSATLKALRNAPLLEHRA